ncbi:rod shape-determining protein RodA [Desulfofundulus salinus]|uniref:Peptidoglycan glycosyltransferase RodA n=1 Tax=Desulfofundulus salinus TaxID=2419843 RepID=A0A494WVY9_9FIRM|nr:rod shape-determining protein RodA [Desulfofundulus salinum]RKO67678.1 rod shape-determining protein RodA [Desulfofundulus salinum]
MVSKRFARSLDHVLLLAAGMVVLFSLVAIGSATLEFTDESFSQLKNLFFAVKLLHLDYTYVIRQLAWIFVGLWVMAAIMYIPYEDLCKHARGLYILNLVMLIAVIFLGREALGAQRWIYIGPFSFQPSEFSKLIMIITFASFLSAREGRLNRLRDLLPCFVYVGIPTLLILKQPDLGTSLVFVAIMFGMLFLAGARPGLLLALIGAGLALMIGLFVLHMYLHNADVDLEKQLLALEQQKKAAVSETARQELQRKYQQVERDYREAHRRHESFHRHTLKEYQVTRLTVFLDPQSDLLGAGYHVWQSLIAIGSGGLLGKGLLGGTQSHLTFLPIRHTDFIFSVVGEEFGFMGAVVLLGLYLVLLYRGLKIASQARDLQGTLLAGGVVCMFAFHIFVNIGMTAGIMPVTGIPLPLFSYGGSNMIMNLAALGLLLNVYMRRKKILF